MTNYKDKISPEAYLKNLTKSQVQIENFLADWLIGVDKTTIQYSNKGEMKIQNIDSRLQKQKGLLDTYEIDVLKISKNHS